MIGNKLWYKGLGCKLMSGLLLESFIMEHLYFSQANEAITKVFKWSYIQKMWANLTSISSNLQYISNNMWAPKYYNHIWRLIVCHSHPCALIYCCNSLNSSGFMFYMPNPCPYWDVYSEMIYFNRNNSTALLCTNRIKLTLNTSFSHDHS